MARKQQQSPKPAQVIETRVGGGGARKREEGEPALTKAQLRFLRRQHIHIRDSDRYTFIEPEVSVEIGLGDDWQAIVDVVAQDGAPVIARVEISPRQFDPAAPSRTEPPRGGLSTRTIRRLRLEDAFDASRDALREVEGETLRWQGFSADNLSLPFHRSRRQSRPNLFYVGIAAAYCDAIKRGCKAPRREVAEQLNREGGGGYSEAFVRDALRVARERGLLTGTTHGVARGQLTPKAKAVLRESPQRL
jgi:hypothetical protein